MRRIYAELYALNNELIGEYTKRSTNHLVRPQFPRAGLVWCRAVACIVAGIACDGFLCVRARA